MLNFSVCPSVRLPVRLSVRLSHPWRGPLRHVCGHTNHHNYDSYIFGKPDGSRCASQDSFFDIRKKIRRKWPPKVHYTALSCSRRGPLRHVCGQTINPTAMICTFLERPTDLDVHPRARFALFGQNRRI